MAVIQRITDFIPNTLILSQEVDDEFNQLVNLLSGVSDDNDTILRYTHATDPVLSIDQLGAGEILRLLQNGAVKTAFDNSGHLYIGEGVTDATPANGLVSGTGGSGSNIAGGNLDVTGGRGTGNAEPGFFAVRYPLRGASGSTLQSLSTARFPASTSVWSNVAAGTAVANTTTETSILTGATGSAGSTLTLQGGVTMAGAVYRGRMFGTFGTTGTPTIQFRTYFGSTLIANGTAVTSPNNSSGLFAFEFDIYCAVVGAGGSVRVYMRGELTAGTGAITPTNFLASGANVSIDFTANQTIDVTAQWGTANAANTLQLLRGYIERIR